MIANQFNLLQETKKKIIYACLAVFLLFCFMMRADGASAAGASMYLSPASGSYAVGSTFSVTVYVSSPDQAINAVSGAIGFPSANLQVVSVSKNGDSKVNLWVQEPAYSNASGRVSFEGLILNPGFQGSSGKVISITFKALKSGKASVYFINGSLLANDGQGTNIVSGLAGGSYNLGDITTEEAAEPQGNAPALELFFPPHTPVIYSPTDPDQQKWYASSTVKLAWNLEPGVNGVSYYANQKPDTEPARKSDGLMSSHTYKNVADGIWYFHLRVRNRLGWSSSAHYKYQIDTKKPDFITARILDDMANATSVRLELLATDEMSGIDRYEIKIDDAAPQIWQPAASSTIFESAVADAGRHLLSVYVYDKAGNHDFRFLTFNTKKVELNLQPTALVSICENLTEQKILSWLALLGGIILLAVLLVLMFFYGIRSKRRISKETSEASQALKSAFTIIRSDIERQVNLLKQTKTKRQLTLEENKIIKDLQQNSKMLEKVVRKEIKDIEKEIK